MNQISKNTLYTFVLMLFLGIYNSYSQSEQSKINNLISQKITYNEKNKTSAVYKIQIYNGNEKDAYKVKQNFTALYPEYSIDIIYNAPEWKTHVGKFKTRLEADSVLLIINGDYAGAIVLEDKI
ncbi:SPOR domain-containing protein [Lutibacter sp. HS1-25]|uniref:SPOR domain-containing protein n=1 Tax=Lutibacter sp. HS1-25 TaxID=2485000 RepID=UPI0010128480|nr:SPOR domain-containing protein [Lutibacter sp. HS1-25]RXP56560.1 SPOR domain-containing protein [Lutibacter sp. HS1-25]